MQSNLSQLQSRQIAVIARLTPHGLAGHILNTTVAAIAVAGSVPLVQLIIWCTYSYSIALIILFRHLKGRVKGQRRSPRNFDRAVKKVTLYAVLLAVSWSSLIILRLGAIAPEEEIVLVALVVGMSASGTILLSAVPPAAFSYMSAILIPSALKCFFLFDQKSYVLLGVLAVSYWAFLAALIGKITRETGERMSADIALLESEARYRALYDDNPSMYLTVDAAGMVLSVNQFGAQALGYTVEELVGQTVLKVIHEEDRETARKQLALCACNPSTLVKGELRKVRRDGSVLWVRESARAVRDSAGRSLSLIVCEDITELKRADTFLKESKARLQEALTAGEVMAFEWDTVTGRSQRSDNADRIMGVVEGGRFFRQVHPDDRGSFIAHIHGLSRDDPSYALTFRFVRSDGRQVWLEETARGEFDSKGRLLRINGLTRDITERKQAELALAERNTQMALAGKASLVATFAYDVKTERVQISEGYAAIYGFSEGTTEIARSQWRALVLPDDLERLESLRSRAFADRQREYALEYRIILPGRGVRWIETRSFISYDGEGRPQRVVGVNIDVTERRRTEQVLTDRNRQLELAAKHALVGRYAMEIDAGQEDFSLHRLQFSPGFAAIYGLSEETMEISLGHWRSLVHPDDLPQFLKHRQQLFAERRSDHHAEHRIVRPCGTIRWIEARSFIEYDQAGHAKRMVGVNIDITERKRAEEARKVLNAELDHRVKNALATVTAVISHTRQGSRSVAEFAAALEGRIRSMAATHELLSSRQWQELSLIELIRRELAPYAASKNIEISGPTVLLKPEAGQALAMVLHELATNAAKYGALSTNNGRVLIRWNRWLNGRPLPNLVLEWQEVGGPRVDGPGKSSYGTSTIHDLIPYEFGGAVDLVFAPEGVRCRLELPPDWLTNAGEPSEAVADTAR